MVVIAIWLFFRFFMQWFLVDKVIILEGIGGMKALHRSKELMKARTEKGFWKRPEVKAGLILLVGFAIAIGINLFFQIPGGILMLIFRGSLVVKTFTGLLDLAANCLATVFTATAMILFYYDIRLRKEGFDLRMLAENL